MPATQLDIAGDALQFEEGADFGWDILIEDEGQLVTIGGAPAGGTFALSWQGSGWAVKTDPIARNATAGQVQTAIESLPEVGTGNVACSGGPLPGTPVVVIFSAALIALSGSPHVGGPLLQADGAELAAYGGTVGVKRRPYDLTGHTARGKVRQTETTADPALLEFSTTDGRISLGGVTGILSIDIGNAVTAALEWTNPARYDIEVVTAGGLVRALVYGAAYMRREVTW